MLRWLLVAALVAVTVPAAHAVVLYGTAKHGAFGTISGGGAGGGAAPSNCLLADVGNCLLIDTGNKALVS